VKLAVIGGGSTYTPELVFELTEPGAPAVTELALHDIDAERLDVVGGFCERILRHRRSPIHLTRTTDLDAAVAGASFVLTQMRVGGSAGRVADETIPLRHGVIGQETTGPGGFAMALRTIPAVLAVADRVRALAPGATLVNFANPAGLVTEALVRAGYPAVGLCNIPLTFEKFLAGTLGGPVEVHSFGLNHLSWIRAVVHDGRDRLPELLERFPDGPEMPARLVRLLRMIPNPYLRYYYLTAEMLARQRAGPTRAEEVVAIERATLARYRDPALVERPPELAARGGAWYCTAAVAFIRAVSGDTGERQVLNVANRGALPGMPDDAVVEVPCRVGAGGAAPIPQEPVPEHCLGLMRAVKSYERLTVEAATSGSRETALLALVTHPLVRDLDVAEPLLDELLAAHAPHLPRVR
jgi:6-phospho-beta-glucosidase